MNSIKICEPFIFTCRFVIGAPRKATKKGTKRVCSHAFATRFTRIWNLSISYKFFANENPFRQSASAIIHGICKKADATNGREICTCLSYIDVVCFGVRACTYIGWTVWAHARTRILHETRATYKYADLCVMPVGSLSVVCTLGRQLFV